MIAVGSTLFGIFVILFIITIVVMNKNRAMAKNRWLSMDYPVACAGSPSSDSKIFMKAPSIYNNVFRTKTGEPIDPSLYLQFVVKGDSMKFCGIQSGSLIFVKKGFAISDIGRLPVVLVLKRRDAFGNRPQFKVRRAWKMGNFDTTGDFSKTLRDIIGTPPFQQLKEVFLKEKAYDSDQALIDDFESTRLPAYRKEYIDCDFPKESDKEFVISTTFHTGEDKVRFSIHPVSSIVGIVSESFSLPSQENA